MRAVIIALLLVVAGWLYSVFWPIVPADMRSFLLPWYNTIIEHGRIGAFAQPFSNYTPPYLYLMSLFSLLDGLMPAVEIIKLLSVATVVFLCAASYRLLRVLGAQNPLTGAVAIAVLPTVALNAPLLSQCDALWSGFLILALAEAIAGRGLAMLMWCGVAFAFKAQAGFFAPFAVGMALRMNLPWRHWAVPPLVYVGMMLPAWLVGWPAYDLATVYLRQFEWSPEFVGNASNAWAFAAAHAPVQALSLFELGYIAAALAGAATVWITWRARLEHEAIVLAALLATLVLPFFLPKMHERYFFVADIIAFALAWRWYRHIWIAAAVQAASLLALLGYVFDSYFHAQIGAACTATAIAGCLIGLRRIHRRGASDLPPEARAITASTIIAQEQRG